MLDATGIPADLSTVTAAAKALITPLIVGDDIPAAFAETVSDFLRDLVEQGGAGAQVDEPAAPYWLTRPCPGWCAGDHHNVDHPDDRYHLSPFVDTLPLRLHPPVTYGGDGTPQTLEVAILQGVEEIAPHLEITRDSQAATTLMITPDELRVLISRLTQLAELMDRG